MGLQEYRHKRDFKKTLEPKGRKSASQQKLIFVVQKHAASHLHYDLRLEFDGVLKSWAVPKGPSLNPVEKRLAIEVEDHPLDYADFEGHIPEGQYGAGDVIVWDRGEWIAPKDPGAAFSKGHIEFELRGQKLSGKWDLVRTRRSTGKKNQWLLIKRNDQFADPEHDILDQDKSVITGLRLPEKSTPRRKKPKLKKIRKTKLPDFIAPQLALQSEIPPSGKDWLHEIKFDGYRTLCHKNKSQIKLLTRSGLDWSHKYKCIKQECAKIPADTALLDGEIVWVDNKGVSHFQGLQNSLDSQRSDDLLYYVFDLLHLNGEDLRAIPLLKRKNLLSELITKTGSKKILLSDHWQGNGSEILASACSLHLEGIVSKNTHAPYESGRGKNWVKSKCAKLQEFVIGGYTLQDNNKSLGALLMGAYNPQGEFQYIGRVGTGFSAKESTQLLAKLKKYKSGKSFFTAKSPQLSAHDQRRSLTFVKPELVAQIEFGAWTDEKILRHAAFKGLRLDKQAKSVRLEESQLIALTNPDKILFPRAKLTKKQLADYYSTIQQWILPYIKNRPLALLRCPHGVGRSCFFQKHHETGGPGLLSQQVHSQLKNKSDEVLYIDSPAGLFELVQLGTLEIHARGCLIYQIDYPNLIVFDLDPDPGVNFAEVKKAALLLKNLLQRLSLKSFVLVSGNKGLHLHVPIAAKYSFDDVKKFSKAVCEQLAKENPGKFTTEMAKSKRTNKIFLDYLRNGFGATAIVPYSVRAQSEACVALPVSWQSLNKVKSAKDFSVDRVLKLLKRARNPWAGYFNLEQKLLILDQLKKLN